MDTTTRGTPPAPAARLKGKRKVAKRDLPKGI